MLKVMQSFGEILKIGLIVILYNCIYLDAPVDVLKLKSRNTVLKLKLSVLIGRYTT